jgi:hypothetical protein
MDGSAQGIGSPLIEAFPGDYWECDPNVRDRRDRRRKWQHQPRLSHRDLWRYRNLHGHP